jgi:hypothetical protein
MFDMKPFTMFSQVIDSLIKVTHNNRELNKVDTRIHQNASTVKDFYFGYNHIIHWNYTAARWEHFVSDTAMKWCQDHCTGSFACHVHRVIYDEWNGWVMNEIGGSDELFWAFENEQDAIMFSLSW